MPITARNIIIGVVCIVVANLLLVALRQIVNIPLADALESAIATGVGVLAWFLIVNRMNR